MPDMSLQELLSRFTHPKILFGEVVVPLGGAATELDQHVLKASRDMIVDRIVISEETYSQEAGPAAAFASSTFLHYLDVNWGVVERPRWAGENTYTPIEVFHNVPMDRSSGGIFNGGATQYAAWAVNRWRLERPWVYNPQDTLQIDVSHPGVALGFPSGMDFEFMLDGRGIASGLDRIFRIPNVRVPQAPANVPFAQSFTSNRLASNLGDEHYLMGSFGWMSPQRMATGAGWPNDLRILNVLRAKVVPSIGDSWSDANIPLIFYGLDQALPGRVAVHKPFGGPIYLKAGQSMTFSFRFNTPPVLDPVQTNVQVALIGAQAPGIGSVE